MKQTYRCWAEIDRSALRHNAKIVRERVGSAEILAVVKANAYGHGLIGVAETLADEAQLFGVANLEEALALRESVSHPIVILGPALPGERPTIAERGFIPTISSFEEAEHFNRIASNPHLNPQAGIATGEKRREADASAPGEGRHVLINFKIDTGMGRMGVPEDDAFDVLKKLSTFPNIRIHSVSTHLPVSGEDADYTRDQLMRFGEIIQQFRAAVPIDYKAHVLQSAGVLGFAGHAGPFDIVRAGIVLYGISPLSEFQNLLKPVMTWKTRISLVRDMSKGSSISYGRTFITPRKMRVATLSAGYADGYPWHLSNRDAAVLVRGQRCAILGRVTMDLMMIDVSKVDNVQVGDEVILMGRDGNEEISCGELAKKAGTITWEITTRIGARVRRVYV
ncbi:MAG TPA: alanine racemase [Candidatus Udaeobacter sp.]|nr:alanine racemase [Candidatus Udaeobacter sp.]